MDTNEQLAKLTARVEALEAALGNIPQAEAGVAGSRASAPGSGYIAYTGRAVLPDGRVAEWHCDHAADEIMEEAWESMERNLRALSHGRRLALLQDVLRGATSALELERSGRHGTSGQIYNHLRQLTEAGWLRAERRGAYVVPVDRVIPLLTVLAAANLS